jgi:hypothetical protein
MFSVTMSTNTGTGVTNTGALSYYSRNSGSINKANVTTVMPSPRFKRVVLLVSSVGANRFYRSRQLKAITILEARGISYEVIDGANPSQRSR